MPLIVTSWHGVIYKIKFDFARVMVDPLYYLSVYLLKLITKVFDYIIIIMCVVKTAIWKLTLSINIFFSCDELFQGNYPS